MGRGDRRLPRLTQEELANPCTRISLDGVEVQLWQVAHIYGLSYEMPSPSLRGGASSQDFRSLPSRERDEGTEIPGVPGPLTSSGCSNVNERTPFTDLPIAPLRISPRREVQQRIRRSAESDSSCHGSGTQDILRLIDELVDECWSDGIDEKEAQDKTAVPVATLSDPAPRMPRIKGAIWADPSFPPPAHPPPAGPLPRVPEEPAGNMDPGAGAHQARRLAAVPRTTPGISSRPSGKLTENSDPNRDNNDDDDDDDADSERTITPRASRRQLVAAPRERNVSMPNPWPSAQRPAAVHSAGRAVSASILRNRDEVHYHPPLHRFGPAQAQSKQVRPPLPLRHPLPDFLLNPPSFLQHPPDLSQQPHLPENQRNTGAVARRDPRPNKSGSTSSPAAACASAPRAAMPTSDDEVALTSRWSSDSEDEKESKMKRLKKVLSFSKLRPRKSSFFQKQTATEAGKSAVSVGRSTSGSSGSRRGSKTEN
ncbi:uncharacterized protein P884DRAFT_278279 [Thermothelomyces heterothallicus CBS 202.75]|uniref:uncharacterized protein n=1 Tax=Thermothelomyces heterothallicus CBS 202.75 TaxID=1149848 RepID=UPI0037448FE5